VYNFDKEKKAFAVYPFTGMVYVMPYGIQQQQQQ
jgi:hypothetical protein